MRLVPAEVPRAGGTAGVCHWFGQCYGDDFCKATHFVDVQFRGDLAGALHCLRCARLHFYPQGDGTSTGSSHWQSQWHPIPPHLARHCHPADQISALSRQFGNANLRFFTPISLTRVLFRSKCSRAGSPFKYCSPASVILLPGRSSHWSCVNDCRCCSPASVICAVLEVQRLKVGQAFKRFSPASDIVVLARSSV